MIYKQNTGDLQSRLNVLENNKNFFYFFKRTESGVIRDLIQGKLTSVLSILLLTVVIGIFEGLRAIGVIALIKTLTSSTEELLSITNYSILGISFNFLEQYGDKFEIMTIIAYVILFTTLVLILLRYFTSLLTVKLRQDILRKVRISLLRKVLTFPCSFFTKMRSGDFTFLISAEASRVTAVLYSVKDLISHFFQGVVFFIILVSLNYYLSTLLVVFILFFFWIQLKVEKKVKLESIKSSGFVRTTSHMVHQILNGIKTIKIGSLERIELKEYKTVHKQYDDSEVVVGKLSAIAGAFQELFFILSLFSSIFLAKFLYQEGGAIDQSSDILPYLFMLIRFVPAAKGFIGARSSIAGNYGPFETVTNLLSSDDGGDWSDGKLVGQHKIKEVDTLKLNNISFSLENKRKILNGINFEFKKGRRYGVVGRSGSGKTTLLDVISGISRPNNGEIILNGEVVQEFKSLRDSALLSYASQDPVIFHSNLKNNVCFYNKNASDDLILKAIKGAQLDNFVNLTDDGMYSSVGNAGQEFSGGERQRIGLARVFLQDASIILIDEGTNALDYKTESLIYKYIK